MGETGFAWSIDDRLANQGILPHPKSIILDLDDTLVDWSASFAVAWTALSRKLADLVGGLDAHILDAVMASNRMAEPSRASAEIIAHSLAQLGVGVVPDTTAFLQTFAQERLSATRPLNGAVEAVRSLRRRVGKLGVLTNGDSDYQRQKLKRAGLVELFDVILVAGDVGISKGEPRLYEMVLQQLGVEAHDAWMVGDSLDMDVAVPQSLGMKGVWVVWPASKFRHLPLSDVDLPQNLEVMPDLIIKRIGDLLPHVRQEKR